ncbi:MAG: ArsR/SmtB family transcription factor [Candidatus Thorarchaeota archaeon]
MNVNPEIKLDIFTVLADPTRRLILDALSEQQKSVNELTKIVQINQSGVSRHLRILQKIGLVTYIKEKQNHVYTLQSEPLVELDQWLEKYRKQWDLRFKKLEEHLKQQKGKNDVQR